MMVAFVATFLSLVSSVMAAYAIVRIRYRGSRTIGGLIFLAYLVPPVAADTIDRSRTAPVTPGSRIFVDQPQRAMSYFSKTPGTPYEDRADLVLEFGSGNSSQIGFERAQTAVGLTDPNPEANETVNLFLAGESYPGPVFEHRLQATVAADDFAARYDARPHGVVYVARDDDAHRLYFQELDAQFAPYGEPLPLTDGVIVDPRSPDASADGRVVLFDADDYGAGTGLQRIYELDLTTAAVRRLTVDPFGSSTDKAPSSSGDGSQFAFITDRQGTPEQLVIEDTANGLAAGVGNEVARAHAADWCQVSDVITFTDRNGLHVLDVDTRTATTVLSAPGTDRPTFSPDCETIAFEDQAGIWTVTADGTDLRLAVADARSPAWVDGDHLLIERGEMGLRIIYVLDLATGELIPVTAAGDDSSEPTYVAAVD